MANEITFDKLPQAVGYLTEQVERIHKIVAALQPQTATDKHRIVEIDEACKITRKASNICRFRDALSPLLDEIAEADGLVLGSPIYFGEVTGKMRAFLERLAFPWLSYNDYSLTAPKRMPVVLVETMNGLPERNNSNHFGTMEWCLTTALGEIERIIGYNTCQVAKYDNYELGSFSEKAKHAWRDEHWAEDLQKAYDAGRRMAEQ